MRRGGRRIAKALAWGALMIMLLPFVLTLVYAVVPPVSTLMLQRWVMGESVDRRWRALDGISPALPVAVAMSEDARFCRHRGVDYEALRTVLDQADDEGPSRGASTIAMQTARNLFLWQGRSYVRKALEIVLAHWLDLVWSKRRVMEVYLNIAEWGEGVFGAEAAAQHAFRRSAASLTREQAALLAAILPNPLRRSANRPSPGVRRIAARILARMVGAAPWVECLRLRPTS
jgi:monofunctional biosynthetic peptidoglycan transglycosylase